MSKLHDDVWRFAYWLICLQIFYRAKAYYLSRCIPDLHVRSLRNSSTGKMDAEIEEEEEARRESVEPFSPVREHFDSNPSRDSTRDWLDDYTRIATYC